MCMAEMVRCLTYQPFLDETGPKSACMMRMYKVGVLTELVQVTYLPISSPFIRFAGRYVDEAFGFAAGWNFFVFEAALVPFEITACNIIIHYWSMLFSVP